MNPKPIGKSLKIMNPNKNQNTGKENACKQIPDKWSRVSGKIPGKPPKKECESWKNQAQKKEPCANFVCFHMCVFSVSWDSIAYLHRDVKRFLDFCFEKEIFIRHGKKIHAFPCMAPRPVHCEDAERKILSRKT